MSFWTISAAAISLAQAFEDRYPGYPIFTQRLVASNLKQPTEDSIRWLVGGVKNQLATAVLDGLELLDGEKLRPQESRYAKAVLEKLEAKPPGQVVNRKELISVRNDVEVETRYQIEPELLLIVLLSLVQNGNITLSLAGKKLDASNISEAARTSLDQLLQFRHIERPRGLPLAELVALFELLGLPEGLIRNPETHEEAVKMLQLRVTELTDQVVMAAAEVQSGIPCWGTALIIADERAGYLREPGDFKSFLEGLQAFNAPGKLRNFSRSLSDIAAQVDNLGAVRQIADLSQLVRELSPLTGYLSTAAAVLPPQDAWRTRMESIQAEWRAKLLDPSVRSAPDFRQSIQRALQAAKEDYRTVYFDLHKKARLGVNEDGKKKELLKDPRLEQLRKLTGISLLPQAALTDLQTRLANLKPCYTLVKDDLVNIAFCPHCKFRPQEETAGISGLPALQQIDDQLDTMIENWSRTLVDNLGDPSAKASIALLPDGQQRAVEEFLQAKVLPDKIGNDLVQGMQSALSGLIAIPIHLEDLLGSLGESGGPLTLEQFRSRVDEFVQKLTRGKELARIRLVIEKAAGSGGPL